MEKEYIKRRRFRCTVCGRIFKKVKTGAGGHISHVAVEDDLVMLPITFNKIPCQYFTPDQIIKMMK